MTVFIDAGGWLSVLIESDHRHPAEASYFQALIDTRASTITTDYVLDEVITRLQYDVGHRKAAAFLDLVHEAEASDILVVRRIEESLWKAAESIFLKYADVRLSFTDCTSFALLSQHTADEVFGFDAHFERMGHILQPKS